MNDNRYIKFVQEEHRHFTNPPPAPQRRGFGVTGFIGLVIWALVVVWFLK